MPEPITRRINTDPEDAKLVEADKAERFQQLEKLRELGRYKPPRLLNPKEIEEWQKNQDEFNARVERELENLPAYQKDEIGIWKYMSGLDDDPEAPWGNYDSVEEWAELNQEYQVMKDIEEGKFKIGGSNASSPTET